MTLTFGDERRNKLVHENAIMIPHVLVCWFVIRIFERVSFGILRASAAVFGFRLGD